MPENNLTAAAAVDSSNPGESRTLDHPGRPIRDAVDKLTKEVNILFFAFVVTAEALADQSRSTRKPFEKFLEEHTERLSETETKVKVKMLHSFRKEFERRYQHLERVVLGYDMLTKSMIVTLVSKWDAFMVSLLSAVFNIKPEIISGSERSLTFAELKEFSSIEEAQRNIIEAEIESLMRQSHSEYFAYLEKKLGMELRKDPQVWPKFIELTERRNLFSHTDGVVSSQYIENCKKHKVTFEKELKVGDKLNVDSKYFFSAYECLIELGIKLGHVIWRKICKDDQDAIDEHYILATSRLITAQEYNVAINLLNFSLKPPMKYGQKKYKLMGVINLAQAHKWLGDENRCLEIVNDQDWSASSERYLLALEVLKDDFVEAAKIMRRIGANGEVKRSDYDEWPLFKKFRDTPDYAGAYKDLFGSNAEIRDVPKAVIEGTPAESVLKKHETSENKP